MAKILIDSGVFVALFDKRDIYHQQAVKFIKNNKSPLITSLACIYSLTLSHKLPYYNGCI